MTFVRTNAEIRRMLQQLAGRSTVMAELLEENDELVEMIRQGESEEACLNFINENW